MHWNTGVWIPVYLGHHEQETDNSIFLNLDLFNEVKLGVDSASLKLNVIDAIA